MQKIKMRQMRIHKRHFQLLELMVAMFILLICIAPTMRIFTTMYQSQQEIIRENQRDHLAHMVHADIVEQLYTHNITFEKDEKSKIIPLSDKVTAELKKIGYEVEGALEIEYKQPKEKDKSPNKYLGKLIIKLRDVSLKAQCKAGQKQCAAQDRSEPSYDFYVYIDSGALHKDEGDEEEEIAQIPLTEQKKGTTSTSSLPADEDEDEEDDEDFFDEDDDEDDEDEDEDEEDDF